jgi:hypothetical protein
MKRLASVLACAALLLGYQAVSAQDSIKDQFDTTKTLTLTGTLKASSASPGRIPAMILMEAKDPRRGGKLAQWFIAGKPMVELRREGWQLIGPTAPMKSGDIITVSAHLPKPGSKVAETIAAQLVESAPPGAPTGFSKELREKDVNLLYGLEITLADGKKLAFGEKP